MGGRGGAGGVSSRNTSSPDYKSSYNIEMENARSFEAAFAIEDGTTKGAIGYQMYVHQDVTTLIKEMKVLICTEFPAHSWRPQICKCKLLSQADLWSPLPQIKEMRCVISTMWPLHSERSLE